MCLARFVLCACIYVGPTYNTLCQMATRPKTRSQQHLDKSSQLGVSNRPQAIPANTLRLSMAASSKEAQAKFLQMVGWTVATIDVPSMKILEESTAELISCALSHFDVDDKDFDDPYFTKEEWKRVRSIQKLNHRQMYTSFVQDDYTEKSTLIEGYEIGNNSRCMCRAHQSGEEWVCQLIDMPTSLGDFWGEILANIVIGQILKAAGIDYLIHGCKQSSPFAVSFVLKLPSGETCSFTGWPDFIISKPTANSQKRRRIDLLEAVGEVQSSSGQSEDSVSSTIAQGGIYGIGELVKSNRNRVVVVVVLKNISAIGTRGHEELPRTPTV